MNSIVTVSVENPAEQALLDKTSARLIRFEDGMDRIVTLSAREWVSLDALIADGWTEAQIWWVPFDVAREFIADGTSDDFEAELRCCIRTCAKEMWGWTRSGSKRQASNTLRSG